MFAQIAHIVAFKPDGARGRSGPRLADLHAIQNLMLLCPSCHKQIDDHPEEHRRQELEAQKAKHEERIRSLTEMGPDRQTALLIFKAPIGGQHVAIGDADISNAVLPRFPVFRGRTEIDLSTMAGFAEAPPSIPFIAAQISQRIAQLVATGSDLQRIGHLSVFGIAPIPLLIHLGHCLTNKVPMDFYQRHRDTENWTWKSDGPEVEYRVQRLHLGAKGGRVALLLSLSGAIKVTDLPTEIDSASSVYEITLDRTPDPTFLRRKVDLDAFRTAFQEVMGAIIADNGLIEFVDVFPAVPAPIAILFGRERLPKAHPGFRIYDRQKGNYVYQLEIK